MQNIRETKLKPYMSPVSVWAFSLGTSIGWGSLVITSSTYLSRSGPIGTVLGMAIGALIMLIISRSYHYMMKSYPDAGGAYAFTKHAFGYDYGFLTSWFLALTYFSILWANLTSLPLFAKYFIGEMFRFGKLYTLFGYEIYLGEALLSIGAVILISLLCIFAHRIAAKLMTCLVFVFVLGISFCFVAAIVKLDIPISPGFQPDSSAITQVLKIVSISTWAFIGFENISHFTEEFTFERKKSMSILRLSVIISALLYIFVTLLSVTAYPPQYASWIEYIADIGNLSGIEGLPAFYAAHHYLGDLGIWALMASLLALVITSLIGNITALSRLLYSLAKDKVIPGRMAALSKKGVPWKTIAFITAVSCLVPFLGRSAIGWIVDVTTIGATLIYGFVAAAAYKIAKQTGDLREQRFGLIGVVMMILFGMYLLVPNLFWDSSMEKETYFIFVVWAVLGIIFFRVVLKRDRSSRFGHSIIVWVALLSLSLFVSLVWMSESTMDATNAAMNQVRDYYIGLNGVVDDAAIVAQEYSGVKSANAVSLAVVVGLFILSVALLVNNYAIMSRRARKSEEELGEVKTVAYNDPLTGVKSKHAYVDYENALNIRINAGDAVGFAVAVCDVNGLKYINDTLGHNAGDQYICDAAKIICDIYKHSPVFRIGGDEFVVVMQEHDYICREELLKMMRDRNEGIEVGEGVIIATGMAEFIPNEDSSVLTVFERADAQMYENKKELKGARKKS